MINIYRASHHALVADEHLKVFYYVNRQSAVKLAQGVKCTVYEKQTLGKIQDYYEKKGYKEVRMWRRRKQGEKLQALWGLMTVGCKMSKASSGYMTLPLLT